MASKEAQSPVPLFLSLLPPPWVSQAPGHRTEPFFSHGAAEATCLLVQPLHRTEFSSLDLCGLGRISVQVDAPLGLQLSPSSRGHNIANEEPPPLFAPEVLGKMVGFRLLQLCGPSSVGLWTFISGDQCPPLLFDCPLTSLLCTSLLSGV